MDSGNQQKPVTIGPWIRNWGRLAGCLVCLAWLNVVGVPTALAGGGPCTYLVLYDSGDINSIAVANYYQQARGIPERNMVPYEFFPPGDTSFSVTDMSNLMVYVRSVIQDRGLTGRLNGIAIAGTVPLFDKASDLSFQGRMFYMPTGTKTNSFNNFAFGGWDGNPRTTEIRDDKPFGSHATTNFYAPVSFVGFTGSGGNTPAEVFALIDRSKAADGLRPDGTIYWPLNGGVRSTAREWETDYVLPVWDSMGIKYKVLSGTYVTGRSDIGGEIVGNPVGDDGNYGNRYLPGAWADHLTSYGGDLNNPTATCAFWIRAGVYGTSGTVTEPLAYWQKFPHAHIHTHFRRGASLAEAFWQSIAWAAEIVCLGDPLLQPWAQFPQVTLNCATNLTGTVALGASATTASPDGLATPFELAIDGHIIRTNDTIAATWTGSGFTLDTTTLADGWHDLRVIAYNNNAVHTQGEARRSVCVNNSGQSVTLTGPATIDRTGTNPYTVTLTGIGNATNVTLQANGRKFATLPVGGGTTNLAGRLFGYQGRTTLYAVAALSNGRQVWSAPLDVDVVWNLRPPTNAAPGAALAYVRYFSNTTSTVFNWDTTPPTATTNHGGVVYLPDPKYPRLSLNNGAPFTPASYATKPGFEVTHYFLAPTNGLYEFLAKFNDWTTELSLEVDGERLQYATGDSNLNIKSVPTPLAAGLHTLRWRFKATAASFNLECLYRGGVTPLNHYYTSMDIWPRLSTICSFSPALDGNQAPQIAAGPTLSADPVTGTAADVSVTVTDPDSGPSALFYRWSKIDGPGTTTFSTNNSSAAFATTVTFSQAGTYRLRVTASDGAATAIGEVIANVAVTPTKVAIEPTIATMRVGWTRSFSPVVQDQFNSYPPDPAVVWTTTGGAITSNGLYTAPAAPGTNNVVVTADGFSATGKVYVVSNFPPAFTGPSLSDYTSYIRCRVSNVSDDLGTNNLTFTWQTVGTPPAPLTFDLNGTSAASDVNATITRFGAYSIRVTVTDADGGAVTQTNSIVVGPQIAATTLTGGNNTLDPNECVNVFLQLRNNGASSLSNITATLATTTPGVTVLQPTSPYPDLAAYGSAYNLVGFRILTDTNFVSTSPTNLILSLTTSACSGDLVVNLYRGTAYAVTPTNGVAIVPGTADIGVHVDDGGTNLALPFVYSFYGQSYTSVWTSSNGNLQFGSSAGTSRTSIGCLPAGNDISPGGFIAVAWSDLLTDDAGGGIFTSITGTAPNRIFNIEWRAVRYANPADVVNCEARLYENQPRFDLIYGVVSDLGVNTTVGVQRNSTNYTAYSCGQALLINGLQLAFVYGAGGDPDSDPYTGAVYTVYYYANGATSGTAPLPQTKTEGMPLALAANSGYLAKTGYSFAGWNTAADGSGTNYAAGASYTTDAHLILYAKWATVPTYAVTYDDNDATSGTAPASQTKTAGVPLTLATNTGNLARTGATFAGWNTAADGSGTNYAAGATYTGNAPLTLFALWIVLPTYTVTYDANGAEDGTAPDPQTKTHDVPLLLADNSGNLVKAGYTFAGWNTAADGLGSSYAAGASYTNNASVLLYAKWVIVPLAITTASPLPKGTLGVPYSLSLLATGGIAPYTWGLASGGLPAGLDLVTGPGAITGTPMAVGTSNFNIVVTDTRGVSATNAFSLAIKMAGSTYWTNTQASAEFNDEFNVWSDGVPGASDTAHFTNNLTYTAQFANNVQIVNSNVYFNASSGTVTQRLAPGATWTLSGSFVVGQNAGSTAAVVLAGSGTVAVTNNGAAKLVVGQGGRGALTLSAGRLYADQLLVTNNTATATNSFFSTISSGTTLTVSNAANAVAAYVVYPFNTTTAYFDLNGIWNMNGGSNIFRTAGATAPANASLLNIGSGAAVYVRRSAVLDLFAVNNNGGIGINLGGVGGLLNVNGGTITNSGRFNVGNGAGSSNNVVNFSDATIHGGPLLMGNLNSSGNTVALDAGTSWNVGNLAFTLGNSGHSNRLLITNGSLMTNVASGVLGSGGSKFNSLVISNGGKLFAGNLTIGNSANASSNLFQVGGGGASVTVSSGAITIGSTSAGFNTMTVTNATLLSTAGTIGSGSSSNTVNVQAGGTWNLRGNNLTVGSGAATGNVLTVAGGAVTNALTVSIRATNQLTMLSGTLSARSLNMTNATLVYQLPDAQNSISVSNLTLVGGTFVVNNPGSLVAGTYPLASSIAPLVNTMAVSTNGWPAGLSGGFSNTASIVYLVVTNIAAITAQQSWQNWYGVLADSTDSDGDGMSNTNEFLAGFNPKDPLAYPHIISLVVSGSDLRITYLGADGDTNYAGGPAARANVLEVTAGLGTGFNSAGLTNILSGGTGLGVITNMLDVGGATNQPSRFYRIHVLTP